MFFNPQTIDKAISDIQKAIGSIDVDGLLLVREDLQAELAIMAPTDTPVRNRLNRIQGNGKAHAWYQLTPTSATEGLFLGTAPSNAFFERGGLPNATQAAYKYKSAPYVSLGDMIVVSFFDQMAGATYADVKKLQTKIKMINTALIEEWAIINGDSTVNPLQFDGLLKQIVTNTEPASGAAFTLTQIGNLLRKITIVGGKPQAIIVSYRDNQRFSDLILSSYYRLFQAGAGALADVPAGVAVTKWVSPFGTLDIIGSRFLKNTGVDGSIIILDDKTVLDDGKQKALPSINPLNSVKLSIETIPNQAPRGEGVETKQGGLLNKKRSESIKELWKNPEYRQRMINSHRGKSTWNKGLQGIKTCSKGNIPWNKGLTKETSSKLNSMSVSQSKSRLKGIKEGRIKNWNDGLTKDTDIRVANQGRIVSKALTGCVRPKDVCDKIGLAFTGEKHPMWKGGISKTRGFDWDVMRKKALERDGYKCQFCGKKHKVVVHHIVGYNVSEDNSLANLITLCISCHIKLEWILVKIERSKQDIVRSARELVEIGRNDLSALFKVCNN